MFMFFNPHRYIFIVYKLKYNGVPKNWKSRMELTFLSVFNIFFSLSSQPLTRNAVVNSNDFEIMSSGLV